MAKWIIFLRAGGTAIFLFGVIGGSLRMVSLLRNIRSFTDAVQYTLVIIESLVLMLLAFGLASGLAALQRMDTRIARATAARRRVAQSPARPGEDLAPVAPDWEELKYGIHPASIERRLKRSQRVGTDDMGEMYEEAIAHGIRVGAPTVREAPPPVRRTPGTEDQYTDAPPLARPATPYRRSSMIPHKGGVDRELLRQGRDKQLRRARGRRIDVMANQGDSFNLSSVTRIPRSMLWVVVIDALLWCAALPAAMAVRYGKPEWLSIAAMGIVFAPIAVLAIYIARLILYFVVIIYWYLVGLRVLITMAVGVGVIVLVLFFPVNRAPPIDPGRVLALMPPQAIPGVGAVLVILALVAVFFLGRLSGRKSAPKIAQPATPALPTAPPTNNIQQQLQQRISKLNPPKP